MCTTCDKARKLPKNAALAIIAQAMQQRGAGVCLDRLVGEIVGEPEPKADAGIEAAWESGRRGR
jgi:hypothetical protein